MSAPSLKECYGPPHMMGRKTPRGGASCDNCRFLFENFNGPPSCSNPCWVETPADRGGGGGDALLPEAPKEFFCDLWEKATLTKVVKRKVGATLIPR